MFVADNSECFSLLTLLTVIRFKCFGGQSAVQLPEMVQWLDDRNYTMESLSTVRPHFVLFCDEWFCPSSSSSFLHMSRSAFQEDTGIFRFRCRFCLLGWKEIRCCEQKDLIFLSTVYSYTGEHFILVYKLHDYFALATGGQNNS